MKVWELKEGVEYKSLLNDVLKYRVDKNGVLYFAPYEANDWCLNSETYNTMMLHDFTEYTPPTDWSKVKVDTKVLVRDWDNSEWIPRHFAKYKDGRVHTWNNGHTSFTSRNEEDYVPYNQAKLY